MSGEAELARQGGYRTCLGAILGVTILFLCLVGQVIFDNDPAVFRLKTPRLPNLYNHTLDKMLITVPTNHTTLGVTIQDVVQYNKFISEQRIKMLEKHKIFKNTNKRSENQGTFRVAREFFNDYFQQISRYQNIKTIALYINSGYNLTGARLMWSKGVQTGEIGFPRKVLYPFGLEVGACKLFMKRGFYKDTVRLIGKNTCEARRSVNATLTPFTPVKVKKINNVKVNNVNNVKINKDYKDIIISNMFTKEYKNLLQFWERIYLHMIPNGRVSTLGIVSYEDLYIDPLACAPGRTFVDTEKMMSDSWLRGVTYVDEVFVSVKFLSSEYFHWNIEDTSRFALYIDFLQQNARIKILIAEKGRVMIMSYLKILGFGDRTRFVWGKVVGGMVYLPQGARCGEKHSAYGLTIASQAYARYIRDVMQLNQLQDTIILIHRTKKRYLEQHETIKVLLTDLAKLYKLNFMIFSDTNLPSLMGTMKMFNRAALVVAPHGAGMVNTMFSQPGTVVIEVMCPHTKSVLCYPYVVRNLGHIYYGIRNDKFKKYNTCTKMWVDMKELRRIVNFYLSAKFSTATISS